MLAYAGVKADCTQVDSSVKELEKLLGLSQIVRMEAYDISNTSGFESVGSMIVYEKGQMAPSKIGIFPNLNSMYNMIIRDTREHMERVGKYSAFFFQVLQQTEPELVEREFGADFYLVCEEFFRLHDIGRVYVPLTILNKVEALTVEEMQIIKNHTIYAKDAVDAIYDFPYHGQLKEQFLGIALYHHEHYDGTGYPEGRQGKAPQRGG